MGSDNGLSVVICTHDPRPGGLARALAALEAQTLPKAEWELLVVDNASREPIAGRFNLAWHPRGRHVAESAIGLVKARLRGIDETVGDPIIFVDDDNVLAPDYLAVAARLAKEQPWIGAWGGRVEPEFEVPPPRWLSSYLPLFAVNEVRAAQWSNAATPAATPPCGAGMSVRRKVAETWRNRVQTDPRRAALGRAGTSLASSEDIDLAFTACDLGYGAGRFPELKLVHLIPKERLELDYFLRLAEAVAASQVLVRSLRESIAQPARPTWLDWVRERWRDLHRDSITRRINASERRGRARAFALTARWPAPPPPSD